MAFIQRLQSLRLPRFLVRLLRFQMAPPAGVYNVHVISLEEELEFPDLLPKELRYALQKDPSLKNRIVKVFKSGKAIGIRTVEKTPERVLTAINNIAVISQHRTIITWLPRLLLTQTRPSFLPADHEAAARNGVDLDEEIAVILSHRLDFKKFVLVDEGNLGATSIDRRIVDELNEAISPIIIRHVTNRMTFDNADTRTATGQAIIKALLFIGPVAQVFEMYTRGIGKLVAASTDDVLAETAELFALRGSGFTWKQLIVRSRLLIPVFLLATYGAFEVDHLLDLGNLALAGFLFGVTSVALSLTTALQSIRMYKECVDDLVNEKKLPPQKQRSRWVLAVIQDFTNPARLGLFIGGMVSPVASMIIFVWFPQFVHNGWVLAVLGTAETVTAGTVVVLARRLNLLKFQLDLNRLLRKQHRLRRS
ncbi:MAG TPA: hypothetical protein VMF88_11955 [Bacteroidota bacterium]|nr:hypothetical protein [Bacteroidota bacterium]